MTSFKDTVLSGLCRLTVGADMLEPNARNRLNDGTKTIVRTPEECCKKCSETSGEHKIKGSELVHETNVKNGLQRKKTSRCI